jgi:hypothetical protein
LKSRFELEWRGGAAEKHFRKLRPMDPEIPWGTFYAKRFPIALVDRARTSWTALARSEYRAAAAFADVIAALLAAKAPLDIVGMAGDFVADELFHSELASRLAMEIGGGVGIQTDFDDLGVKPLDSHLDARERANELVIRVACISETLSGAMAVESMRELDHPLVVKIMERIARDEARHTRLGWLYLEWATEEMSEGERLRLAKVARNEIETLSPLWKERRSKSVDGVTTEGYCVEDLRQLGWIESTRVAKIAITAVETEIVAPLAELGILVERD